jgi:hypothetical protein
VLAAERRDERARRKAAGQDAEQGQPAACSQALGAAGLLLRSPGRCRRRGRGRGRGRAVAAAVAAAAAEETTVAGAQGHRAPLPLARQAEEGSEEALENRLARKQSRERCYCAQGAQVRAAAVPVAHLLACLLSAWHLGSHGTV